ncbi:hypothetical protein ACHAWF_001384 [Thalassiosira exigua]
MMKGVIYGLLRNYFLHNTKEDDNVKMATLLFPPHVARGRAKATMKEYILAADAKLRQEPLAAATREFSNKERLFIHIEYHPRGVSKHTTRMLYDLHCHYLFEDLLDIKQSTVAYSRPKNI